MTFEAYLDEMKEKHVYFQYHLNCQDITDNAGDNKLYLMESIQNTVITYFYVEILSI